LRSIGWIGTIDRATRDLRPYLLRGWLTIMTAVFGKGEGRMSRWTEIAVRIDGSAAAGGCA
jgi:hypothetical protein